MEENENTLDKAVEALKNEQIPPGPPQEVIESTIIKLTETAEQTDTIKLDKRIRIIEGLKAAKSLVKIAAAAVLLIAAGYATGRLSGPQPLDMAQIQAALEPKIRQRLLDEMKQYVQVGRPTPRLMSCSQTSSKLSTKRKARIDNGLWQLSTR